MTVLVVNYRSGTHLDDCLRSLFEAEVHPARVIVVDNASGDASAEPARALARGGRPVELIESDVNLGLAGGVNLALGSVSSPYLAILNPDVTVTKGWLRPLVEALDDPGVAVACPLVTMSGSQLVNSLGQTLHVSGLGFNRFLGRAVEEAAGPPHDVAGLHGAAFVIRTDLLRALGGWDETGFLYHEDVALSWDLLLAGYRIVAAPESVVEHDYHLTMYPDKFYLLERNRWALLLSHLRWRQLLVLVPVLLITEIATWSMAWLRGREFLGAKARSYGWLVRSRGEIAGWRRRVMTRPRNGTSLLLSRLSWRVPLDQVAAVSREGDESPRVPEGGLPTEPTLG